MPGGAGEAGGTGAAVGSIFAGSRVGDCGGGGGGGVGEVGVGFGGWWRVVAVRCADVGGGGGGGVEVGETLHGAGVGGGIARVGLRVGEEVVGVVVGGGYGVVAAGFAPAATAAAEVGLRTCV